MLASILLKEDEELTAEVLEAAVRALRRIHLRRRQEEVQQELKKPGLAHDQERLQGAADGTGTHQPGTAGSRPGGRRSAAKPAETQTEKRLKQKAARKPSKYLRELQIAAGAGDISGQPIDGAALMC